MIRPLLTAAMSPDTHPETAPTGAGTADEFTRTRRSLVSRLKNWEDRDGWCEFMERYGKFVFSMARRAGFTREEAEDVLQDTMVSVAKKIPDFRYEGDRGSFKAWLVMIVRSRITDHLRKKYRRLPAAGARAGADRDEATRIEDRIAQHEDPLGHEAIWQKEWEEHLLEKGLERVKGRLPAKHFLAFRMCAQQHRPPAEVARMLGLSLAKVYLIRHRASRALAAEIDRLREGR